MEQVLNNLISNAIKYGGGKPIHVGAEADGTRARITVRDHGMGIAETDVLRIFGRFERSASARAYGGLGLGLYICKQIIEAHRGTISVTSQNNSGSAFIVELPLDSRTAQAAAFAADR
jgi:signal transduction histidine kinase